MELGFRILIVSEIPDSLSCIPDSASKSFPDYRFHKQKFPRFRVLQVKVSQIPDFTSKSFPDCGFYKQKFPGFRILQAKFSRISDSTSNGRCFRDQRAKRKRMRRRQVLERIYQDNRILVRHLWNLKTHGRIRRHTTYFKMVEMFMSNIHAKDSC